MQIQRREIISAEIACSGANKTDTFTRVKKTKNIWAWAKKKSCFSPNCLRDRTKLEGDDRKLELLCVCVRSEITREMLS